MRKGKRKGKGKREKKKGNRGGRERMEEVEWKWRKGAKGEGRT